MPDVDAGWLRRLLHGPREHVPLDYLLAQADPDRPLPERVVWLTALIRWVGGQETTVAQDADPRSDGPDGDEAVDPRIRRRGTRIRFLLNVLDRNPAWETAVARTLRSVLRDARGLRLFATTGLPQEFGFWGEFLRRIGTKLLPEPPAHDDLAPVLLAMFPKPGDALLASALPAATRGRLAALFRYDESPDEACWAVVRSNLNDAIVVLAAHVAAIGLHESVRGRSDAAALDRSPFVGLGPAARDYVEAGSGTADVEALAVARRRFEAELAGCRRALADVRSHLEDHGVSIGLVYATELARQKLDRIERLVTLAAGGRGERAIVRFVAELVRDLHAQRSVRAFLAGNLDLLTRKIAERTGKTGEHYITRDRNEYREMLRSAGVGGALTGFTVAIKFALVGRGLAPFVEGLAASLNYAVSFCLIQVTHGTLATKQPAMTAAAMAAKLKEARRRGRLRAFVDEVAALTRSQVAAIFGNLAIVIPAALLIEVAWTLLGGTRFPAQEKAHAMIDSLSVIGPTPVFAVFTGVLLWASAVLSGAIENWATYRRLPAALAGRPRLVYAFGAGRMKRVGRWIEHNIGGLGGNTALGFLLGMSPVIAEFFGIPLEVRHVTLSTGSLALAVSTLGVPVFATMEFWLAVAGIAVVGVLNLTVSFSLALWVAIRATRAGSVSRRRVYRAVLARLFAAPRDFLFPPRESGAR